MAPLVSVLLSVHNGGETLAPALDSLLAQDFSDFEIVAVDDGSDDGSGGALEEYARRDARVKVLTNQRNIGLTRSLNRAFAASSGELIARQDADDVSEPGRLAAQAAFLAAQPKVGLLGGAVRVIDAGGRPGPLVGYPVSDTAIRCHLPFGNPFCHSAMMFRRGLIPAGADPYDETLAYSQDYELWGRLLDAAEGANLPGVLVNLREAPGRISQAKAGEQRQAFAAAAAGRIEALRPGRDLAPEQVLALHDWWGGPPPRLGPAELALCRVYFDCLRALAERPGMNRREVKRVRRALTERLLSGQPLARLAGAARRLGLGPLPALAAHLPRRALRRLLPGRSPLRPPGRA